jgi:hypothetical protein
MGILETVASKLVGKLARGIYVEKWENKGPAEPF